LSRWPGDRGKGNYAIARFRHREAVWKENARSPGSGVLSISTISVTALPTSPPTGVLKSNPVVTFDQ
jgi:hypothetical protein